MIIVNIFVEVKSCLKYSDLLISGLTLLMNKPWRQSTSFAKYITSDFARHDGILSCFKCCN